MIKLLAVDMDGTCLDSHNRLPQKVLEALTAAQEAGILVVPTTGRTLTCLPRALRQRGGWHYVISSNGAELTDMQSGQSLFQAQIPAQRAAQVLRAAKPLHLGISTHQNHEFLLQGRVFFALGRLLYGKDAENTRCIRDIAAELDQQGGQVEEIQLFFFTKGSREKAKAMLAEFQDLEMAWSGSYVEIYSRQATKGTALAALGERLGLQKEEIACIGDAANDLPMFAQAGLRFAMGNAIQELKDQADVIVASNDEDGVAQAIYQHLLGREAT